MKELFLETVEDALGMLKGHEVLLCSYGGEESDFCRLNGNVIRQAGHVSQHEITLRLIAGKRHTTHTFLLRRNRAENRARLAAFYTEARHELSGVPDDPYLLYNETPVSSETIRKPALGDATHCVHRIQEAAGKTDLVGVWASGPLYRGFANSLGQTNWFEAGNYLFDWCLYLSGDKAVKDSQCGTTWDEAAMAARLEQGKRQLAHLQRPAREIKPGKYRAFVTSSALQELFGLLNWGGFGTQALRTKNSPLMRLAAEESTLSPKVNLVEDVAGGLAPDFDGAGFKKPASIALIQDGRHAGSLTSARSAKEFGLIPTGASGGEHADSLAMAGGNLTTEQALADLGEGLYVSNFWYMNYSDRPRGRVTGMTRFATFWVEGGKIVAPVNVVRFDDSFFDLFGPQGLEALTPAELHQSPSTYGARQTGSMRLPGALLAGLTVTL